MGVIAKQSIKGTIVTYMGVAIGALTTLFVQTRFLTTEEVGLVGAMIDAATFFISLAQLGTSNSIIRFFPYFKNERGHHGFFFWTIVVPLVGFAFFGLLFWLCRTPIGAWFGQKSPLFVHYYYLLLPLSFFMLYMGIFETNANVLMHIVVPRAVREIGVRVGLLIIYLLYAFRVLSIDGFMVSICGVYAVASLINLVYLFRLEPLELKPDLSFLRENKPVVKQYVHYSLLLLLTALANGMAPIASAFFITAKMGLSFTGIFKIATNIAVVVSIPYRSMTAIAAPQLAAAMKQDDRAQCSHLMQQCCSNLLLVGSFIFLLVWLNVDLIYHVIPNGEVYGTARLTVLILMLAHLMMAVFNITISTLSYSRYYGFSLLFSFLLTVGLIVSNTYFIPHWGMNGAALSTLVCYFGYFTLVVLTVVLATKTSPFARRQIGMVALAVGLFVLNELWLKVMPDMNIWLSSVVRTVVLLGGGMVIAYKARMSEEINALLHSVFVSRK